MLLNAVLSQEGRRMQVHKTPSIVFLMLSYENLGVILFSILFCMSGLLPLQVAVI